MVSIFEQFHLLVIAYDSYTFGNRFEVVHIPPEFLTFKTLEIRLVYSVDSTHTVWRPSWRCRTASTSKLEVQTPP